MISSNNLNKPAVVTAERSYSYQELFLLIEAFANRFQQYKPTKVAIFSENRVEWIAAFYAAQRVDATAVTIDFMASNDDVAYILNDSKPDIVCTGKDLSATVESIVSSLDYKPAIINFEAPEITLPEHCNTQWQPINFDNPAVIIYTSGTTGKSKGVMLSFRNLLFNVDAVSKEVPIYRGSRQVLMLLPLHHIFPLCGSMVAPLNVGATIVMASSMQSAALIETLQKNQVAIMIGVPRLYEMIYKGLKPKIEASVMGRIMFRLMNAIRSEKLAKKIFKKVHKGFGGHLEFLVSGGAALPPHVGKFFSTLGFKVLEGYGMTETAPMITFTRPDNIRIGSVGQPLPGIEVKTVEGEIAVKGPNVMLGYYNRQEETAQILRDGWLYTGDLGYFDKDGFIYLTGRKKEIIVLSNGKNINPVELEQKLEKEYPVVKEAGVFEKEGKLVVAIVPNKEELAQLVISDIHAYFREQVLNPFNSELTSYKRIMKFFLSDVELPRTRLSKLQRFKLAKMNFEIHDKKSIISEELSEDFYAIKSFLEAQVDMDVYPDHHIEFDLALDSLGKVSMLDYLEKSFGVKIDEKKLASLQTVRQISEYVKEKRKWFKQETLNLAEIVKEKVHIKLPSAWPTVNVFKSFSKWFFKLYFKYRVEGRENIPSGPCIIAPNHQSFFDGMFVVSFLKHSEIRRTYFYAKKKHINNAILRFLANTNNIIIVDLEKDLKESIQKLAAALKAGRKVVIFPEGTRSKTGNLGEFKKTFAILSSALNVPVVPVAISGANKALPLGAKIPRFRATVKVKYLEPVTPEGHSPEELRDRVYQSIVRNVEKVV